MEKGAECYSRFLDGDRDALVDIIREYRDGMILFADGVVNDLSVAEDVVQEVFVRLIVKKPKFSGKCSFKTWLYSICRHTAADFYHKQRRRREIGTDELSHHADDTDIEQEFVEGYIKEDRRVAVRRAMKRLNEDYCQVLHLTFIEGFDNSAAANIMKKSNRQIENLIYRAKKALKTELEKEGFVYEKL